MSDNDQQVRTLFAAAADDIPPGIDLLRGFRSRRSARRVRVRVALASAAAGVVAVAAVITLTIAQAPSALAQLTSAVSRTTGQSYRFGATITQVPLRPDAVRPGPVTHTISGVFDPPQKVGEETISSSGQVRFVGAYAYLPTGKVGKSGLLAGKPWLKVPSPALWSPLTANQQLRVSAGVLSLVETSPQNLFALLKSVSTVDREGSVSGPGWTGTRYAFTVSVVFGPAGSGLPTVTATGTVDVDQQGRVGDLDAAYTLPAIAVAPPERVSVETTFSDFGVPVSVSAPPASEVFTPANFNEQPGAAPSSASVSVPG
jgi:hypothetical protein